LLSLGEKLLGHVTAALDLRSLAAAASTCASLRSAVHGCGSASKRQRAVAALLRYDRSPRNDLTPPGQLSPTERTSNIDFITGVGSTFKLHATTQGLAVQYFDRFMSAPAGLDGSDVQLVGLAALMLASKFADTKVPALTDFGGNFSPEQLKDTELMLLQRLGWDLNVATPHCFLEQMVIAFEVDHLSRKRADFYIDASYYDACVLKCTPMTVAASSLLLSWKLQGLHDGQPSRRAELALLCGVDQAIITQLQGDIYAKVQELLTESL